MNRVKARVWQPDFTSRSLKKGAKPGKHAGSFPRRVRWPQPMYVFMHLRTYIHVYSLTVTFLLKTSIIHDSLPLDNVQPLLNIALSPLPAPDHLLLLVLHPQVPQSSLSPQPSSGGQTVLPQKHCVERQPSCTQLARTPAY